ncbi:TIGR03761 family integrating conjugative element protein [Pluralibacter gergoviae]|uniref:PFL_4669 family integrating conjugative element protein n=1 Tax=Enterobacterales TaxID=91347 RepID=UPI0007CC2628|nr:MULTISPECIES: TIGR03761 family integrating conjugative element protein [Enterobacterales]EKV9909481.1 TIGR03761 family integrating conjugative element protein [Pluralibacter gergoviae]SAQ03088.1 integrating conjugative element protein%2C PFL_4669 family [Klebsiella oxytoca]HBX4000083.1 TIGR03761 family integrating conjugative element protein [Klebsiella variicola]ELD4333535.1 TIGR03761 family integrating conjugative element protein [Pluralibacter gergoviae]MBZ6860889.1 TIGR03761 family inte
MADTTERAQRKPAQPRAGALKSTLTVQLHTQYAILLWEGRQRDKETSKPQIVGMPQVIARAGKINADSNNDNPYADHAMLLLEEAIERGTGRLQSAVADLDTTLSSLPGQVSMSEVSSVSPLNIGVFSRTPLGYRCVWLLVGFDQLAMKAFQAWHYGLISRQKRDELLSQGGHWVRQVYGVVQQYRSVAVMRDDIRLQTPAGIDAVKRLGQPDADIMSGAKRSAFSPPLRPAKGGSA